MKAVHLLLINLFTWLLGSLPLLAQQSAQSEDRYTQMRAVERSAVLLGNHPNLFPIKDLSESRIVAVHLEAHEAALFDSIANLYASVASLSAVPYSDSLDLYNLEDDLQPYKTVIVTLTPDGLRDNRNESYLKDICKRKDIILVLLGEARHPIAMHLKELNCPILYVPSNEPVAANIAAQMVFGGMAVRGKLRKPLGPGLTAAMGNVTSRIRLKYTYPEELGIDASDLKGIDQLAEQAIAQKAAPGMVVLAARNGKVFLHKAYGFHSYDKSAPTQLNDIFDLASVTKITATTPAVMHLVDKGKLDLNNSIGTYIARARKTAMSQIKLREVMLHEAGFVPFINFAKNLTENDYSADSSDMYPTKVAANYYVRKDYFKDTMWPAMLYAPILTRGKYVYSDISMYVMQAVVESITSVPLNQYVEQMFYRPLGMKHTSYLPYYNFDKKRIVPTEDDQVFRKTQLLGYVHDEGAALKGGVAGHAGLFASATDLATYYQMLLNKGFYGGRRYFQAQTVSNFTKKQSSVSRRGYGFDRTDPRRSLGYPSKTASLDTYGHTGYTGTSVWVDQSRGLVFIFLSNRVNPERSTKIYELKTRAKMQDIINKAIDASY